MFDAADLNRELTTSGNFNNVFNGLLGDVKVLYEKLEGQYSELDSIYNQNTNNINNILNQLGALQTQLYEYQRALVDLDGLTQLMIEDFHNGNNIENNLSAYQIALASADDRVRPMVYVNNYNKIESFADVTVPLAYTANITQRNYMDFTSDGEVSNILNDSSQAFWYETVKFNESVDYLNFQYETGIVAELTLDLKEITKLNKIVMRPFSSYPMRVIRMSYFDLLTQEEIFFNGVENVFIEGIFNISFPEIYTHKIKVRLQQVHYEKGDNEYIYNIGLYSVKLLYNAYSASTQFMSSPIPLKRHTAAGATEDNRGQSSSASGVPVIVDYYALDAEDSGNIDYAVIEYFEDAGDNRRDNRPGEERHFKRDILTFNITRITREPIQPHFVNGKYVFQTRYPFKDLILYMNGNALVPTMEYFLYDDQTANIFNFNPEGIYTADYSISDRVVRNIGSGNNDIQYIRLMAYSRNAERPAVINSYTLKIRYKKRDDL